MLKVKSRKMEIKLGRNTRNQKLNCGRVVAVKVVLDDFIKMTEDISMNKSLNAESRAEVAELLLGKLTMVTGHINCPDDFKEVRAILLDTANTQPLGISILKIAASQYFREERAKGTFHEFGFDDFGSDSFMANDLKPVFTSSVISSILENMKLKDVLDKLTDEQIEIIREIYMPLYQFKVSEIDTPRWYNMSKDILISSVFNFISTQLRVKRTPMTYLINRIELMKVKFKTPMFEDMIKSGELVKLVSEKFSELYANIDALDIAKESNEQKDLYTTSVELTKDLIGDIDTVGDKIIKVCEKLLELIDDFEPIGYMDRDKANIKIEQYGTLNALVDLSERVSNPWSALIIFNFIINILVEVYVTKASKEDFKDLVLLDDNR